MAARTTHTRYFIAAPVERVYAHLADPMNYVGLSPLISTISALQHEVDADGVQRIHYKTVEKFVWLGVVRYNNPLDVTLTLSRLNEQLISDVRAPLKTRLRFLFEFASAEGGMWISEQIDAEAPIVFLGYVVQQALAVQAIRSRVLQERFAGA